MDNNTYNNLLNLLTNNQFPEGFNQTQQRQLEKQAKNFTTYHNLLYKTEKFSKKKTRVILPHEMDSVLYMFHNDTCATHESAERMMEKMKSRYYWPQMFENIRKYVKTCDACQRRGKFKRNEPLHPIPVGAPFHRIGIDYVGPLPTTKKGNKYIIVAMDYLTKWPEAKPTKEVTAAITVEFVYEDIISRHGCL